MYIHPFIICRFCVVSGYIYLYIYDMNVYIYICIFYYIYIYIHADIIYTNICTYIYIYICFLNAYIYKYIRTLQTFNWAMRLSKLSHQLAFPESRNSKQAKVLTIFMHVYMCVYVYTYK